MSIVSSNPLVIPADSLIVLKGIPGSGKSTFAYNYFENSKVVRTDHCRFLVTDNEADVSADVFSMQVFYAILRGRLAIGKLAVADGTHVTHVSRMALLELAREHNRPAFLFDLMIDPFVARTRNRSRDRVVPEFVMDKMEDSLRSDDPLISSEPWTDVLRFTPDQPPAFYVS